MELIIGNSTCSLIGYNKAQYGDLRRLLSYNISKEAAYHSGWHTKKYLFSKKGEFPTGLLYLVQKYLDTKKLKYIIKDVRIRPTKRVGFGIKLDV